MIVRIMGQGQWQVPKSELTRLNVLDDLIAEAVDRRDGEVLADLLDEMGALVRTEGTPLPPGEVAVSDLIVPNAQAQMAEIAEWLQESQAEDGLIPG